MRRRKYISIVASGTALSVAGCFGSDDTDTDESDDSGGDSDEGSDETGDEGGETGEQSDVEGESESLDDAVDVVITNDHDEQYSVDVTVTDENGVTMIDDEVTVDSDTTERFEDVIAEPGEYTIQAAKSESVSQSVQWEVTHDTGDVHVHITGEGEFEVDVEES